MKQHCKECRELKNISDYYSHPQWKNWVLWRCKECIKRWRKTDKELKMARIRDKKRSNSTERLKQLNNQCKKYRSKYPEKYKAHWIVNNYFRYHLEDRPKHCSNCNTIPSENKWIVMHHEDYNKPREIIALCKLCHSWYHSWRVDIDKTKMFTIPF